MIDNDQECWCCWQAEGEMIRACSGCKDQMYIHTDCIEAFVANQLKSSRGFIFDDRLQGIVHKDNIPTQQIKCARCLDYYDIKFVPVPSYKIIRMDWVLMGLFGLMTVCVLVMAAACFALLLQLHNHSVQYQKENDKVLQIVFDVWYIGLVEVRLLVYSVIAVFSSIYVGTLTGMLLHERGYYQLRVAGK